MLGKGLDGERHSMLPTNLSAVEIVDVGIISEGLAYRMYDRLGFAHHRTDRAWRAVIDR